MDILKDQFSGSQTPFLGLKARLSQVWFDSTVCVVALYIVKLVFLKNFLTSMLKLTEHFVLRTCSTMEEAMNAAVDAPSQAVRVANILIADAVNRAIGASFTLLDWIALAIMHLILFFIEMTIGTWTCLTVTLFNIAANESLDLATSAVSAVNSTVVTAANDIADFVVKIEDLINGATGLINSITAFVKGENEQIASLNATLDTLRSISIPSNVTSAIDSLRKDIPTYSDAQAALTSLVSLPFNKLRTEISIARNSSNYSMSALPRLPRRSVSVCNAQSISHEFSTVSSDLSKFVSIFIALCAVSIVFILAWRAMAVYRRWCRLQRIACNIDCVVARTEADQHAANMSAISFGTMSGLEAMLCDKAANLTTNRNLTLWLIQYAFSEGALAIACLGIMGMIITGIEYIVFLKFNTLSKSLATTLTQPVTNATTIVSADIIAWQLQVNDNISSKSSMLNEQLLGWVRTGTSAINNSLARFIEEMDTELNKTIGGTPFYKPIQGVIQCVIGNKVSVVETGLTWVHNKAHFSLPEIPNAFVNSTTKALNASSSLQIEISDKLDTISSTLGYQLRTQAIVSGIFIAVWLLIAIMGSGFVLWQAFCLKSKLSSPLKPTFTKSIEAIQTPVPSRRTAFFVGPERRVLTQTQFVPTPIYTQEIPNVPSPAYTERESMRGW